MRPAVYLLCWSGSPEMAEREVASRYPECQTIVLNQREFREQGWRGQLRILRKLRGRALIYFFYKNSDNRMPQVLAWSGLAHGCRETILASAGGDWKVYRRRDWICMFPRLVMSAACDLFIWTATWLALHMFPGKPTPSRIEMVTTTDLLYLFPFALDQFEVGGMMTHVLGFLGGLAENQASCKIYSGRPIETNSFAVNVIPRVWPFYLFHELATLSFNWSFAVKTLWALGHQRPRALYQRHRAYALAGALLSRWLRVPLILEFNGSEIWIARNWDPARFPGMVRLCEEFSLASASLMVVVSEVLRDELVKRGIPASNIIVNPNGVDPLCFQPGCGGNQVREDLGVRPEQVLAGFVGTFSYWHGVDILREAILKVLDQTGQDPVLDRLKFLLIGTGPLFGEMKKALSTHPEFLTRVDLPGTIAHELVPSYLDATDMLLSPHVPTGDGRPFFGSPTKLFEYMAMAKGIVASRLGQIAAVLEDGTSALLVSPGNADELVYAMRRLAADSPLRERLGRRARECVMANFTWAQNAGRVLQRLRPGLQFEQYSDKDASHLAPSEFTPAS